MAGKTEDLIQSTTAQAEISRDHPDTEMVERVVAALIDLPIRDWGYVGGELDKLRLREAARAAIEAMREPTQGVLDCRPAFITNADALAMWQTMISAALGEKP